MNVDGKPDSRAALAVDEDIGEYRCARDVETRRNEKTASYSHGFNGLVDSARPNALDVNGNAVFNHARDCAGNGRGRRFARYLQEFHEYHFSSVCSAFNLPKTISYGMEEGKRQSSLPISKLIVMRSRVTRTLGSEGQLR